MSTSGDEVGIIVFVHRRVMARIAIIGAGISGLSAAKLLSKHEVVIFESLGGRVDV